MSYSIEQLRAQSDDELIRQHDGHAVNTIVGVSYFLEELDRRDRARGEQAALQLARASNRLAIVSAATSFLALVVAVVTLFVTR